MIFFTAAAFTLPATPEAAETLGAGGTIVSTTSRSAVAACGACHGADGEGQAAAGIPRLAGLDAAYLNAQLAAFRNGTRANAAMRAIVKTMDPKALRETAAYYASLPAPPRVAAVPTSAQIVAGEEIATRGDWNKNVPPCASCHGLRGLGVGAAFPPVAGQSAAYIAHQLEAWTSGTRHDDPLGMMRTVATRLDERQIAAVAAYYASLPGTHPARSAEEAKP